LSVPFFDLGDNIRWGYLIGVVMMLVSISILIVLYSRKK
jgi:hypothetical protein